MLSSREQLHSVAPDGSTAMVQCAPHAVVSSQKLLQAVVSVLGCFKCALVLLGVFRQVLALSGEARERLNLPKAANRV
eukprot:13334820-Alexandrium_andersonii.AAC.1